MNKAVFTALGIVVAGTCALLFGLFYWEAKNTAIAKLNEEQMIHAKQAARGIEDSFGAWTRDLTSLSKMDEIIDNDAVGQRYMKLFYEVNQEQVTSITRVDEKGVIVVNFPIGNSVGTDISGQNHIRQLLRDHKPVVSDVFRAVEGFNAVALHVPVFKGGEFRGSIGILINFQSIAHRYLEVIKIGETGSAWVISRDGTKLYSPVPGQTGKSVFDDVKEFPSLTATVDGMLKGGEGTATYTFDRIGERKVEPVTKYAAYMPVHVGDTFWSIAVNSAEQDVLSGLISFRNKLAIAVGVLFVLGLVFATLGAKAWLILKEEEQRKRAEKKLQESERATGELTRSNQELEQFAHIASHDLQEPLRTVKGFLDLFQARAAGKLDDKEKQYIGFAVDGASRMQNLITDLLAYSRAGSKGLTPSTVSLRQCVDQAMGALQQSLDESRARVAIDELPTVTADAGQLAQVFQNLIGNALKFRREGVPPEVTIGSRQEGGHRAISVKDNGIGIDPGQADRVFEIFQRLHGRDKYPGTGIGLAICKRIVERHGGRIWVESTPGEGSTFFFTLPMHGAAPQAGEQRGEAHD